MKKSPRVALAALSAFLATAGSAVRAETPKEAITSDRVEAMRAVHAKFTGKPGTFAHFGDSTTETLAFWTPLLYDPKGMSPDMERAHKRVVGYLRKECWRDWKGPEFGNQGRQTVDWAAENVGTWLKKLNPEVVLVMFGSNDVREGNAADYGRKLRSVVRRCLDNGSVVILTTAPPRSGFVEQSKEFADSVRRVAAEFKVPLIDYQAEILKRRPTDWDGSLPQFKEAGQDDPYQVPTLIAADGVHPSNPSKYGDWTEDSLRHNGYALRSYLTLMKYAELLRTVIDPAKK
jgi:lysophospholipase L1-like esterase